VRIGNFGFLANRKRAKLLPLCFHLFGATPQPQVASHASGTKTPRHLGAAPNAVDRCATRHLARIEAEQRADVTQHSGHVTWFSAPTRELR